MNLKNYFIKATEQYNTFEKNVPAYYFRRSFNSNTECEAKITVAVCGFYELYFNGKNITRGFLSPYISNPNDFVYYDEYTVSLNKGENVIGLWLGNGFQNNPGGHIWEFELADFRSAPLVSLAVTLPNGTVLLNTDSNFKIAPSPVLTDDYRFGEVYNANCEINGWNCKGFDDSGWQKAISVEAPKGELRVADVDPVVTECELKPVAITKYNNAFIYDFGVCNAGVCRLNIKGEKGQTVTLRYADTLLENGDVNIKQIWFEREHWNRDKDIVHRDVYVLKGTEKEEYIPHFTYHGFRYVKVEGITEQQATPELLTYLVYHTKLQTVGDFTCSDTVANKLQEITRRSIVSNFHHFPTDCPQREKNGWTADAALTSEAALMNFTAERNYREWMRNICKAQNSAGALPGIVPTAGWGFDWGNGPAWDSVLAYVPYYTYLLRGKTEIISESAEAFVKYLKYLRTRVDEKGLLHIGLGDWCHAGRHAEDPKAPLSVTDTAITIDIANKMEVMFNAIGKTVEAEFAKTESEKYKTAFRENLINYNNMTVFGECQTSQAMGIYYNIFNPDEIPAAVEKLVEMVKQQNDHLDVGVLGGRILFRVLSDYGYGDLAYKMITRPDFPAYGYMLENGATTLWESFASDLAGSNNHHFWGDISAWFIEYIAGIRLNPQKNNVNCVAIKPNFINKLTFAEGYHIAPNGKIVSKWERNGKNVVLKLQIPQNITATVQLPCGFAFTDGSTEKSVTSGEYTAVQI